MTKSPCKDCFDRTITCHTVCRRYQEWKTIHAEEVERARQAKENNSTSRTISDTSLRKYWQSLRYSRVKRDK